MFLLQFFVAGIALADNPIDEEKRMSATGSFEITMEPQVDESAPAGRMILNKEYSGGLVGTGVGQMISKRTESGSAAYSAIEEFEGTLDGKTGSFTLIHNGFMSKETQSLEIGILIGSGGGELENISGSLEIIQEDGEHRYILHYEL